MLLDYNSNRTLCRDKCILANNNDCAGTLDLESPHTLNHSDLQFKLFYNYVKTSQYKLYLSYGIPCVCLSFCFYFVIISLQVNPKWDFITYIISKWWMWLKVFLQGLQSDMQLLKHTNSVLILYLYLINLLEPSRSRKHLQWLEAHAFYLEVKLKQICQDMIKLSLL